MKYFLTCQHKENVMINFQKSTIVYVMHQLCDPNFFFQYVQARLAS